MSQLQAQNISYSNISYERIQDRRAKTPVPCSAGGMLHDYIPCYFGPRSPMLYTINRGNVPRYTDGQTPILYLITTAEKIAAQGLAFAFTDGHAVMAYTSFYDSLDDLENVDLELMQATMWNDTLDDGDRKRRRQAEFLVYQFLPWNLINGIAVINTDTQQQVQTILKEMNQEKSVAIRRHWYY